HHLRGARPAARRAVADEALAPRDRARGGAVRGAHGGARLRAREAASPADARRAAPPRGREPALADEVQRRASRAPALPLVDHEPAPPARTVEGERPAPRERDRERPRALSAETSIAAA